MDGDRAGGGDADPDHVTPHLEHGDRHLVADDDALANAAAQDQHEVTLQVVVSRGFLTAFELLESSQHQVHKVPAGYKDARGVL